VVSLSILHRAGMSGQEEREDYLRFAPWKPDRPDRTDERVMSDERFAELAAREQFVLTVCANGYGKISSAFEYRRTGRGGQGITNIDNIARNGPVVASFPVSDGHQLMLVTDQAKLIRIPINLHDPNAGDGIAGNLRVTGRGTAGVRLFDVAQNEHIVSAARIEENEEDAEANLGDGPKPGEPTPDAIVGEDLADGAAPEADEN